MWGTLSCTVICPAPEGPISGSLEHALARLEYGAVCLNIWSAFAYGEPLPWSVVKSRLVWSLILISTEY